MFNPLMANDAFRRHKRFHLLEKGQFSQGEVQMCENHQVRRADFGGKNPRFFGAPPALKCTHGGCTRGVPSLQQDLEGLPLAPSVALVWLLHGRRLHQFVCLGGSQRPRTVIPQLCTLHEHAVLANLVINWVVQPD